MKRHCCKDMISFVYDRLVVIIDILVLRRLGGIIIMQTC